MSINHLKSTKMLEIVRSAKSPLSDIEAVFEQINTSAYRTEYFTRKVCDKDLYVRLAKRHITEAKNDTMYGITAMIVNALFDVDLFKDELRAAIRDDRLEIIREIYLRRKENAWLSAEVYSFNFYFLEWASSEHTTWEQVDTHRTFAKVYSGGKILSGPRGSLELKKYVNPNVPEDKILEVFDNSGSIDFLENKVARKILNQYKPTWMSIHAKLRHDLVVKYNDLTKRQIVSLVFQIVNSHSRFALMRQEQAPQCISFLVDAAGCYGMLAAKRSFIPAYPKEHILEAFDLLHDIPHQYHGMIIKTICDNGKADEEVWNRLMEVQVPEMSAYVLAASSKAPEHIKDLFKLASL